MKDWLQLDRREFLTALGATYGSAACAWAAPKSWFVEYASAGEDRPRELFVNTLCPMCPGGCGLVVRVVHGCAVGVRGNKDHPANRGGLCSRASAVLQDLYNPDRLQHPLRRVGPRGSGRWEEIGWGEAIETLATKLGALRSKPGPQALCAVLGRDRGVTSMAWRRFMSAYGSPNLIDAFPDDNLGVQPAVLATHGVRQRIGYDLAGAAYVLSFSSGWLDAHWSAEQAARAFAEFRRGRPGFRPRWVHVEPRFSLTATKADEWIPIRPGSEGTLAMGIAHVMIREGLYDRTFVERYGFGFEDWVDRDGVSHLGFRRMVLQHFSPSRVEAVTGVPEGAVFRLAREYSNNRPALALGFDGGGCRAQATYDRMAIHCLNALSGSIDVPGGVVVFQDLALLELEGEVDDVARRGLARAPLDGPKARRRLADNAIDRLTEAIENGRPYSVEAAVLVDADPVFALAEGARFGAALSGVPFVVAFSGYHNDTNRHADLILPVPHGLHRWDYSIGSTLKGHPIVTISQPVIKSPSGMRDPYDVLHATAQHLGGFIGASLPWSSSEEAVDAVCRELFNTGKGAAFGPANEESWAQLLESRGWRAPFSKSFEDFKRDVLAGGGWTDPIYFYHEPERVFRSPPGKFAFSSAYLAQSFKAMPATEGSSVDDRKHLPDCRTEERSHDATYPLEVYVYSLPNLTSVASPNLPWLNDIAGAYMFEKWRTWVEIHPETAERFDLTSHDRAEVQTPRGKLVLPVRVYAGLMRDVIAIPFGFGHKTGGRWCAGIGENPADIVDARVDPLTGTSLWTSTRATIRKV
ncbi:MAG: molybdopterin-dependent oxidoreductase [Phycisphaerae bacterium]